MVYKKTKIDSQYTVMLMLREKYYEDFKCECDGTCGTKKVGRGIECISKKNKYDLILLKQTIHFFSSSKLKALIDIAKKRLEDEGKILIFSLKTTNNKIPCFKRMRQKLDSSLKRDEKLLKLIKKKLKRSNESYFNFKVNISKQKYLKMVKSRYISCLLDLKSNEISRGISELKSKYKYQIKFTDTLKCISYKR